MQNGNNKRKTNTSPKPVKKQRVRKSIHVNTANAQQVEERELARVRATGLARWFSGPAMPHVDEWKPD